VDSKNEPFRRIAAELPEDNIFERADARRAAENPRKRTTPNAAAVPLQRKTRAGMAREISSARTKAPKKIRIFDGFWRLKVRVIKTAGWLFFFDDEIAFRERPLSPERRSTPAP
jgi:hypothetical protein